MESKPTVNHIKNLDELPIWAAKICDDRLRYPKIWMFHGPVGAGKTTLIKLLASSWGYQGETSSPTFSLINVYTVGNEKMVHMDAYRVDSIEEAVDAGIFEYIDEGAWLCIEWPENLGSLLIDEPTLHIYIEGSGDDERVITLQLQS